MKCKIPEISWHNRDPVLSVDIQPSVDADKVAVNYRLATGGTDSHVLIWSLILTADGSDMTLDLVADLTRHQRAVNAVKWSPNGELLASGDDESFIFIWKQKAENDVLNIVDAANEQDKEVWITLKILRGHMEDIYDLSWSLNSLFLVSGSVDNSAMIWDVHKGKSLGILRDHKGFVQGVAWDPKNQYIATLSTDRYLRIFDIQSKRVLHRINKSTLPVPEKHALHNKRVSLFHDDTLQTYFRRLCFTPDGKLLLTPAGVADYEGASNKLHTSYAFSRHALRQPALLLPSPDQYTVAIRCCPLLFKLRPYSVNNPPLLQLPYRMIYAIATRCSVYFYDTQQKQPFAVISNIHYTRLTDITWSSDGRVVVVSSTDGFCSLITFENDELGVLYEDADAVFKQLEDAQLQTKKSKKSKENETMQQPKVKIFNAEETKPLIEKPAENIHKHENNKNATTVEQLSTVKELEPQTSKLVDDGINDKQCNFVSKVTALTNIIIDKEILSSDEKFESPEKKTLIATPISVRRHPRTPNITPTSVFAFAAIREHFSQSDTSPVSTGNGSLQRQDGNAASPVARPIAIRRTRLINTTNDNEQSKTASQNSDTQTNQTLNATNSQPTTPSNKTPRRVDFRTISTPKSKKKLLD